MVLVGIAGVVLFRHLKERKLNWTVVGFITLTGIILLAGGLVGTVLHAAKFEDESLSRPRTEGPLADPATAPESGR